jgi:hypothetical protein
MLIITALSLLGSDQRTSSPRSMTLTAHSVITERVRQHIGGDIDGCAEVVAKRPLDVVQQGGHHRC